MGKWDFVENNLGVCTYRYNAEFLRLLTILHALDDLQIMKKII